MRRYIQALLLFSLFCISTVFICLHIGGKTQLLSSGDFFPSDMQKRDYQLTLLASDTEADSFSTTLLCPDSFDVQSLRLVITDIRSFELFLNGQFYYAYAGTPASHRVHDIPLDRAPLSGNQLQIEIKCSAFTNAVKCLIAHKARVRQAMTCALVFNLLVLGMYIAIVFYCLILYLAKNSESYLFYMVLLTIAAAVTGCLYLNYPIPHFPLWDILHMGYLHALSETISFILCLKIMRIRFPAWLGPHPALAVALGDCLGVFLCNAWFSLTFRSAFIDLLVVRNICVVLWTYARGTAFSKHLLLGLALSTGIYLYYSAVNLHWLTPNSYLFYIHLPVAYYMVFVFFCLAIVSSIFAQKFSESERLAREIEKSNLQLDEKVHARTAELNLTYQKLEKEQAEKNALMINLCHDIRSPLFSIIGYAEMIRGLDQADQKNLYVLREQLDYLSHLIENLFLAAKLEEHQITFMQNPVSLKKLCEAVAEEACVSAQKRHTSLVLHLAANALIIGDGFRLRQALENIVFNAIIHTPEQTRVDIILEEDAQWAHLVIKDNGQGIRREELPYIFDRYYSAKKRAAGSSGLGLAIAKEIIDAHSGTVTVSSTFGQGTLFSIHLPLAERSPYLPIDHPEEGEQHEEHFVD